MLNPFLVFNMSRFRLGDANSARYVRSLLHSQLGGLAQGVLSVSLPHTTVSRGYFL